MKICHNHSKKKRSQGLAIAANQGFKQMWNQCKVGRTLAWSLPLVSLLALAPTARAQVATSLDWGVGAGGEAVDFAPGSTDNTYVDVGGSGVDVRVSVVGAVTASANPNLVLGDSDFVGPAPPEETLLVPLDGTNPATVTIQFFATGTPTPVDVTLA